MKIAVCRIILVTSSVYLMPAITNANIIGNNQSTNECGLNKIEVIVGGKVGIEKTEIEQSSKCFISTVNDPAKTKSTQLLKLDKSIKHDRTANNLAIKENVYDKSRRDERNNILNSELIKATAQKADLLKKKLNGQFVDELQVSRLEADINALQRELSR